MTALAKAPSFLQSALASIEATDEFNDGIPVSAGLPTLSIRGRAFRIIQGDDETVLKHGDAQLMALNVILVASRPAKSKRWYPNAYESGGDVVAPACFSTDGKGPDAGSEEPQAEACAACPLNVYGSKATDGRPACSDYKRIVVVIATPDGQIAYDADGNIPLARMDVPATSLTALRKYNGKLRQNGVPVPWAMVTKIFFEEAEYPKVGFDHVGYVTEETFKTVEELRESEEVQLTCSLEPTTAITGAPTAAPSLPPSASVTTPPVNGTPDTTAPAAPQTAPEPEPESDGDKYDDMSLDELRAEADRLGIAYDKQRSAGMRKLLRGSEEQAQPEPVSTPPATPPAGDSTEADINDILNKW